MRRAALYPLILVLALVTAVALLGAAAAVGDARGGPPSSDAATEAAVRRFYAGANAAILTGDAARLEEAVAPDLVDHAPPPGVAPDRAGLARYLAALHATSPGAELVVADLVAVGDRALARVAVCGADRGAFLGMPLTAERPYWATVDAFRVADGLVVERWGGADGLALLEPLGRAALGAPLPARQVAALDRLEVAPGGRLDARHPAGARLVYLETGALTVEVSPDAPGSTSIAAGELVALPPNAQALRNDAEAPAVALVLTVSRAGALASDMDRCDSVDPEEFSSCAASVDPAELWGAGAGAASAVAVRPLAGARTMVLPDGPLATAIGRVSLGQGAELSIPAAVPGILFLEEGTLDLQTDAGTAWVRHSGTGVDREAAASTLGAGDGALVRLGSGATLRNGGEAAATALVVTILPTDDAGTGSRRTPAGADDGSQGGPNRPAGFRPDAGPTP